MSALAFHVAKTKKQGVYFASEKGLMLGGGRLSHFSVKPAYLSR